MGPLLLGKQVEPAMREMQEQLEAMIRIKAAGTAKDTRINEHENLLTSASRTHGKLALAKTLLASRTTVGPCRLRAGPGLAGGQGKIGRVADRAADRVQCGDEGQS